MEINFDNLYLVYVEKLTETPNAKGFFEYEFYFSSTPDIVWGTDWNQQCPSACNKENMRPDASTYEHVAHLDTIIPFVSIGENSCFSGQDMVDGIVACAWEDISDYEEYPEPVRLVFNFGEGYKGVETKLALRHQFFRNWREENNEERNENE